MIDAVNVKYYSLMFTGAVRIILSFNNLNLAFNFQRIAHVFSSLKCLPSSSLREMCCRLKTFLSANIETVFACQEK